MVSPTTAPPQPSAFTPVQVRLPSRPGRRAFRRLLDYIWPHRKYAGLTIAFGVLGFALSFAYPWIIGSVVDLIASVSMGELPESLGRARLVRLTELAGLTALLHALVVYGRGHFNVHLGDGVVTDLRRELFDHLQLLSLRFYAQERTGAILSRILHDVREATSLIYMGLIVVGMDAVQLVIATVLLASISWKLTLACFGVFPLYAVAFAGLNGRVQRASEKMHGHFSRIAGNVAEQLSGQAVIKTYVAEQREARRFRDDILHHHGLVVAQSHAGHLVASSGEVLVHLGTTIVVGYGGWLALQGEMTPGMVTRFLGYVLIMYAPVRRFAELNITYQSSLSAMRRVFRLFEIRPAVAEIARPRLHPPSAGQVHFRDIRFRYADDSDETQFGLDDEDDGRDPVCLGEPPWVLDGLSLDAQPGERIAIVGASGAGKTTLLSLLPRLYDVNEGQIVVDGTDVRAYGLAALRSSMAIVQQETFVFTGTIRDNIAYGRPNASDEELVRAAKAAHAHEFVMRLPGAYQARLGERGVNLSGGQRQRISIARALLKDPRILILDEATSSLDAESEAIVQEALDRLMRSRTCFIIAHRLSTIRNVDRICVLSEGRIVESGSHRELVLRNGLYARLIKNQGDLLTSSA